MKVLKNYKILKMIEEFPLIKIREDEDVFIELPICAIDYNRIYKEPVIFQEINKMGVVIEKEELVERLKNLKLFYFLVKPETGEVKEVSKENSNYQIRLPKDVDVSKLEFYNGEIYLVENQEEVKK